LNTSTARESWTQLSFRDLGIWVGGGTPPKKNPEYWDGDVPWVSSKDMVAPILSDTTDHISKKALEVSAAKRFAANSIAFVVRSGILEHTLPIALVPFDAAANQDMRVLTPRPDICPQWLLLALLARQDQLRRDCQRMARL
jgi:type I restriction enzyme, S subunit